MEGDLTRSLVQYVKNECAKIDMKAVIAKYREEHKAELEAHQREMSQARHICSLFEKGGAPRV